MTMQILHSVHARYMVSAFSMYELSVHAQSILPADVEDLLH